MKRSYSAVAGALLLTPLLVAAQSPAAQPATSLPVEQGPVDCYDCGGESMRVLLVGAHPDDEDTNLIAWLQKSRRAQTAYLSLTRGDGGQNLIGNELGEELGIIRTEELLAARRVDGAHQFFSRAYDFGFSKSAAETYAHWPKDSLLNDVVTVIRSWRPHIIVTMFSGTPRDGHGHHQVSALLAKEAYALSGDTIRFPVRTFGVPWTALKLYQTARFQPDSATVRVNVGEYNQNLGRSYAEIAGESRSQHKSQGFGALQRKGVVWNYIQRLATRVNEQTPAKSEVSMFDGIAIDKGVTTGSLNLLQHVALEAFADRRDLALGDSARVTATIYNRSRETIFVTPVHSPDVRVAGPVTRVRVQPDSAYQWPLYMKGARLSMPWWLATPRNGDLFSPRLPVLRAREDLWQMPEDIRSQQTWVAAMVEVGGGMLEFMPEITAPIVFRYLDPIRGDVQRPVAVTPRISVSLENSQELARASTQLDRFFKVTLRSAVMKAQPVVVSLTVPAGLNVDSASRSLTLDSAGTRTVTFRVRGRLAPGTHAVSALANAGSETFASGYIPIEYDHISPQRLYRPATVSLKAVDLSVPAKTNIGYIHGVGDKVAPALSQLGIPVTMVNPADIPTLDLAQFSAIVVGPRAYEASSELTYNNGSLLNYARNGGTLVVQYGQYEMMRPGVMPYAITISRPHDRVTEEVAPVTILDASSPALTSPNRITAADFEGWVQERGLYMPRTFDGHFGPVIEMNDPGAPPNRGGILVAPYGKGLYVYTTLAFFRQLPAGVSGAAKLFVNLISSEAQGVTQTQTKAGSQ